MLAIKHISPKRVLTQQRKLHREGKDDKGERFVAVLGIPSVESAITVVRVQIVKDAMRAIADE